MTHEGVKKWVHSIWMKNKAIAYSHMSSGANICLIKVECIKENQEWVWHVFMKKVEKATKI